jgi:hypothetical protein
VKSMVGAIAKSGLIEINAPPVDLAPPPAKDRDPWAGIFPQNNALRNIAETGIRDAEDGGVYRCLDCMHEIWDGVCSGCGRGYAGRIEAGDEAHGFLVDGEDGGWWGPDWLADHGSDDDDGEGDHDDDGIAQEVVAAAMERILGRYRREADEASEDDDGDEGGGDDGYESSFIDDDDGDPGMPRMPGTFVDNESDVGLPRMPVRRESVIEIDSDSDVPVRSAHGRSAHNPIVHLSSDEDLPAPPPGRRRSQDVVADLVLSGSDIEDGEERLRNLRTAGVVYGRNGRLRVVASDEEDDDAGPGFVGYL